jgi:phosphoenolpyruvate---glycerone phosphotransferase subunit DhaK
MIPRPQIRRLLFSQSPQGLQITQSRGKFNIEKRGAAMQTKKIINSGDQAVDEMLDGLVAAHPKLLRRSLRNPRAIVAVDGPRQDKVGLVIGGGSGHEPTFSGFVGRGLADAAAIGDVFTSPTPDMALDCAREVNGGAGVLFMYGHYQGDVLNFDMAAELAAAEGIEVRMVLTTDDVASAPLAERGRRRGVAGNFFIFKAAGAACDQMKNLADCERIAHKANDATCTMGVALGPCSLPGTRKPNFEIGSDEMEIGMGIHGELGIERGKLATADEITDRMLDRILGDMQPVKGSRVAVLVNSLGSTPLMELYIMNRRLASRLKDANINVHATHVGHYCTSLEMAGASITLMQLDGELQSLLDHPCNTPALRVMRP